MTREQYLNEAIEEWRDRTTLAEVLEPDAIDDLVVTVARCVELGDYTRLEDFVRTAYERAERLQFGR